MGSEHWLINCHECATFGGGGVIQADGVSATCPTCSGRGVVSFFALAGGELDAELITRGLSTDGPLTERQRRLRAALDPDARTVA